MASIILRTAIVVVLVHLLPLIAGTRLVADEADLIHSVALHHHHQDNSLHHQQQHGQCEPISVEICAGKWYNQTTMPNLLGHQKQDEVGMELMQFMPLIKVNCSEDIHLFLCSIYVLMCSVLEEPIPPCRSLCESARKCEDIMRKFEHSWPENLECSQFPTQEERICFAKNTTDPSGVSPTAGPTMGGGYSDQNAGATGGVLPPSGGSGGRGGDGGSGNGRRITMGGNKNHQQQHSTSLSSHNGPFRNIGFVCPLQLKAPPGIGYQLSFGGKVSYIV